MAEPISLDGMGESRMHELKCAMGDNGETLDQIASAIGQFIDWRDEDPLRLSLVYTSEWIYAWDSEYDVFRPIPRNPAHGMTLERS